MTIDERLARVEHVTARLGEQFKQDHEEIRQLWRDTQQQLRELVGTVDMLGDRVARLTVDIDRLIVESAVRDKESRERDRELGERVDKVVPAIGQWLMKNSAPCAQA